MTGLLQATTRVSGPALAVLAFLFLGSPVFPEQIQSAPEQAIKAAYLCNFATYIEWPGDTLETGNARLMIGVFGDDSLADELERITTGRMMHGRPVDVRRLDPGDPLGGLHVLFIGEEEINEVRDLIEEAQSQSILVVTESMDALELGSVINFRLVDQRVRFEVSLDAADKSRLTISSRLLSVAEYVKPRTGG